LLDAGQFFGIDVVVGFAVFFDSGLDLTHKPLLHEIAVDRVKLLKLLGRLVATAFSQRRKTLRNALKTLLDESELRSLGVDPGKRPETLPIADYVTLANYVSRRGGDSG